MGLNSTRFWGDGYFVTRKDSYSLIDATCFNLFIYILFDDDSQFVLKTRCKILFCRNSKRISRLIVRDAFFDIYTFMYIFIIYSYSRSFFFGSSVSFLY
jgi:hypothetical protein